MQQKLLTIQETSKLLKISKSTCYKLAKEKVIPALTFGGNVRINGEKLLEWIDKNTFQKLS